MTIRTGIYVRISQDPDGTETSTQRQEEDARHYAAGQDGWDVVDVHLDADLSAYSDVQRPAFNRLREDVAAGRLDAVIACKSDRVYRNLRRFMSSSTSWSGTVSGTCPSRSSRTRPCPPDD